MTDAQKLEALIKRAIDDEGWRPWGPDAAEWKYIDASPRGFLSIYTPDHRTFDGMIETKFYDSEILFNHDFARALFGERETRSMNQAFETITKLGWQDRLQAAVISNNPVDYMYKAVFGDNS